MNKVGERYSNSPDGGGTTMLEDGGVDLEDVSSFCGMDINNHMEGKFL